MSHIVLSISRNVSLTTDFGLCSGLFWRRFSLPNSFSRNSLQYSQVKRIIRIILILWVFRVVFVNQFWILIQTSWKVVINISVVQNLIRPSHCFRNVPVAQMLKGKVFKPLPSTVERFRENNSENRWTVQFEPTYNSSFLPAVFSPVPFSINVNFTQK